MTFSINQASRNIILDADIVNFHLIMDLPTQLAQHVRQVYFGGNYTAVNLKEQVTGLSIEQVKRSVNGLNSIHALTYHIHYYARAISKVLNGGELDSRDALSFDHPEIQTQKEWEAFLETIWQEAKELISRIENLPSDTVGENFVDPKYGSYYRNIQGMVEHSHYHLGQIVLIKKLIARE